MYGTRNQVVLPLNLETKIKGDDPVFKLAEICDTLDYTELYKAYVRTYRKYDPAMLFRQARIIRTRLKRRIFGIFSLVVFVRRQPYCILRIKIHSKMRSF